MKYSVLIVNYNLRESVAKLVVDLEMQFSSDPQKDPFEILIFDNASQDDSRKFFENHHSSRLTYIFSDKNLGFGAAMNRLAKIAKGEILVLLNPDLEIPKQQLSLPVWIERSLTADRVLITPNLIGTDQKPQANGGGNSGTLTFILQSIRAGQVVRKMGLTRLLLFFFSLPILKFTRYAKYFQNFGSQEGKSSPEENYDWVSGAFWVLRHMHFSQCGGFDENIFLYCEDEDLCRRLKALTHLKIVKSNLFFAIHAVSGTQKAEKRFSRARLERLNSNIYFLRKWHGSMAATTLRFFYFFYFLAFAKLKYSVQALLGIRISDSRDSH